MKKHLFSDTDTEPRPDDSRNEVSWLQDYNRRPKPNVVDYSRQRHGKPPPSPGNGKAYPDHVCYLIVKKQKHINGRIFFYSEMGLFKENKKSSVIVFFI